MNLTMECGQKYQSSSSWILGCSVEKVIKFLQRMIHPLYSCGLDNCVTALFSFTCCYKMVRDKKKPKRDFLYKEL